MPSVRTSRENVKFRSRISMSKPVKVKIRCIIIKQKLKSPQGSFTLNAIRHHYGVIPLEIVNAMHGTNFHDDNVN